MNSLQYSVFVSGSDYHEEAEFLLKAIGKIKKIEDINALFASLIEVTVHMLNDVCKGIKLTATKNALSIIAFIIKLCTQFDKDLDNVSNIISSDKLVLMMI